MIRRIGSIIVPLSYRFCQVVQKPTTFNRKVRPALRRDAHIRALASCSRTMSSLVLPEMNLNYQDVVQLTGENKIILIDVREPKEIQDNGVLPNSINVPLNEVRGALEGTSEEFQKRYGTALPAKDAPIVFSCHAGGRSMKALLAALDLGFKNAKHYAGGFSDWKKNSENPQ